MEYKVVVFSENKVANYINNPFVEITKKTFGDACLVWDTYYQKDLEYISKNKDVRVYEKALDFCYENKIEFLYIVYLHQPEHLLLELETREVIGKAITTKIIVATDWRLTSISKTRLYATYKLFSNPIIYKMIIFSNLGPKMPIPDFPNPVVTDSFKSNKLLSLYVPPLATIVPFPKVLAKNKYNLPYDKFIFLYFGAMYYGKGIDILLRTMKKIEEKDILLFISSGEDRFNFDINKNDFNNDKIIWKKVNVPNSELIYTFGACDAVVLPYRKTYTNCGSSVLIQACQARKPVIMPNITPFKEVVEEYKLGLTFEVENEDSLKEAMVKMSKDISFIDKNAKFDEYLSQIQKWENFIDMVFKENK